MSESETVFSTSTGDEPTSDTTTEPTDTTDPGTSTEPEPEPEPAGPASLAGKVVSWDGHDWAGNPRTLYGLVLREHEWAPGKVEIAPLPRDYREYDPATLTVVEP